MLCLSCGALPRDVVMLALMRLEASELFNSWRWRLFALGLPTASFIGLNTVICRCCLHAVVSICFRCGEFRPLLGRHDGFCHAMHMGFSVSLMLSAFPYLHFGSLREPSLLRCHDTSRPKALPMSESSRSNGDFTNSPISRTTRSMFTGLRPTTLWSGLPRLAHTSTMHL